MGLVNRCYKLLSLNGQLNNIIKSVILPHNYYKVVPISNHQSKVASLNLLSDKFYFCNLGSFKSEPTERFALSIIDWRSIAFTTWLRGHKNGPGRILTGDNGISSPALFTD